ncbi:MAG: cytochrome c oxidase subunit II [Planctomycetota bacterium]|nr:cytochrome c oxidase subunit II [Planctomycetota bacterium]
MLHLASQKIVEAVDGAFVTLTVACLILMIIIMGALVWFAFKYHRSRHPKPARIHGSLKLEITWTIIPTLIALWMFMVGYDGFQLIRTVPDGAYVVEVEGKQWSWTFTHPETGVTDSTLYVPAGRPIKCELSSSDVLHSLYIPAYRVKEDCVPGLDTYLWFEAEVGEYNVFCAEFCGNDHAKMITKLIALPQADFDAYLERRMKLRFAPVTDVTKVMDENSDDMVGMVGDQAAVVALYSTYCKSCHGANGEGGLVEGARSFRDDPVAKWKRGVTIPDIFRTLTLGIEGTRMAAFDNLSAWERFALAHYVAGFYREGPQRSVADQAAYEKLVKEYKLDEQKSVIVHFPIDAAIDDLAKGP